MAIQIPNLVMISQEDLGNTIPVLGLSLYFGLVVFTYYKTNPYPIFTRINITNTQSTNNKNPTLKTTKCIFLKIENEI